MHSHQASGSRSTPTKRLLNVSADVKVIYYEILPILKSVQYFAYSFFMHGLSIMNFKGYVICAYLFSSRIFQHLTNCPLSVFGTEMISSDQSTIDISYTL